MPAGSAQLAKRALVTLLLILARKYDIPAVVVNRDSPDGVVLATFKKVSKKVHPDKGGSTQDFQKLNNARDEWNKAPVPRRTAQQHDHSPQPHQDHTRPNQRPNPSGAHCRSLGTHLQKVHRANSPTGKKHKELQV